MRLPKVLKQFALQSSIWTALCFATVGICRFALHLGYPYNYPAPPWSDLYWDFIHWRMRFLLFHSPQFYDLRDPLMYPAPVVVFYKILLLKPVSLWHPQFIVVRFAAIMLLTSWAILVVFRKALIRRGLAPQSASNFVLVTYLCSFPFWVEMHQGNMEFFVWIIVAGGIWAFWNARSWTSATLFGVAIAMKIFPAVFIGLFVARKQYRQAVYTLVAAAVTQVISLWLVCPDIRYSWQQTSAAVNRFRVTYMLKLLPMESGFDHSLFCLFKRALPVLPPPEQMSHILNVYLILASIGFSILFFARIRKLPIVNQIVCLSIAAIFLPPTSYDYTLLHLYAPFAVLVFVALQHAAQPASKASARGLFFAFCLLAFLLAPESEFIYHGLRVAGYMKAVALLLLWIVALIYPFELTADANGVLGAEVKEC
jgi:Glycosyltransferase family 87